MRRRTTATTPPPTGAARTEATIAALRNMTVAQLRDRYAEVFGEPTRSGIPPQLGPRRGVSPSRSGPVTPTR